MDYEVASIAADWWILQMKKCYKEANPCKVTGEEPYLVVIDDSFRAELSRFRTEFLNFAQTEYYTNLTCCFFPNRNLSRILKKSGLSSEYLPVRAQMQFCGDHVKVSIGEDGDLRKLPTSVKRL